MYVLSPKPLQSRHTSLRVLTIEVRVRSSVLFLVLDHLPGLENLRITGIIRKQLDSLASVADEKPSSSSSSSSSSQKFPLEWLDIACRTDEVDDVCFSVKQCPRLVSFDSSVYRKIEKPLMDYTYNSNDNDNNNNKKMSQHNSPSTHPPLPSPSPSQNSQNPSATTSINQTSTPAAESTAPGMKSSSPLMVRHRHPYPDLVQDHQRRRLGEETITGRHRAVGYGDS